ncbi:peptidoglycan-binding domain-containing protein [Sedimentitalea todarodis]|uniref:Peptidoglycan-binding domain-containing protein n=1 Tax=Sedimentitalea todarodis TaxID=1631240 RepID=A0ABU3VLN2_9RHOB|nr:peptidoglycan-binding domain-containing protein [Sedimentitalea todarodis]MDU9007103.1 peptidoglycan-binding domain-containing protein [Sedimentitalea todarodis]
MPLKLTAPVGDKRRITKPDPKAKNTKFPPVRNVPADVEVVRLMLNANGYSLKVHGKSDGELIKAIREFQKKKLGYNKPDGIVDPGGRTWKAGLAKLAAQSASEQKIEWYEVVEGGKTKRVTKAEFEAGQRALQREVRSKSIMMNGQVESWISICNGFEQTRQATDGYFNAFVEFSVSVVNDKTNPPWSEILAARSEASLLKSFVGASNLDWKKIYAQDQKATKAYNKAVKAFKKFISERIGTAGSIVGNLEIVRDTSFTVVETYMTARLVATKGMSVAKANAIAAAGTEALKSGAGQFGEYVAGNKVSWDGAAKKVMIDSFIAGLSGAAGGKLGSALTKGLGAKIAAQILPRLSGNMSKSVIEAFFQRFLGSKFGQTMVTGALKETIGLFKPLIEKGRAPNLKEVKESVAKILTASILDHAAGKALSEFTKRFPTASADFLKTILAPKSMQAMRNDLVALYGAESFEMLAKKHSGEMFESVAKQLSGNWLSAAAVEAVNGSDGSQNAKQMQKLANDALRKDKDLRKKIENMIKSEFANRAKKLEKA